MVTALLIGAGAALVVLTVWLWRSRMTFLGQSPVDYRGTAPVLDLRRHLNGALLCDGVIYGPLGRVTSRFVADINVTWQGDIGTMTERFRYDNGAFQNRCWTLTLEDAGRLGATAGDVIGTGRGQLGGATLRLTYRIKLAEDAGSHVLNAVDWMYLLENGTIVNRSQFYKYGIKVAELVATLRPKEML